MLDLRSGVLAAAGGARLRHLVAGSGLPVLVPGSAVYYPRCFSPQLRQACRMAFADLRHFADCDPDVPTGAITLDTYVDDLDALSAAIGFERFALVGHSHHGNLALEYAKRRPERISHLVLIGSPPCDVNTTLAAARRFWEDHADAPRRALLQMRQAALAPRLATMAPEQAFIAQYVAEGPMYWHDAAYDASSLWADVPIHMPALAAFRSFFADGYRLTWDPAQMRAPVLVVMGRQDYVVPHTLWQQALPRLPALRYALFESSGHTPQLEEAAGFNALLLDWLRATFSPS